MSIYAVLSSDQVQLELDADALLARQPADPGATRYSERQLRTHGMRHRVPVRLLAEIPTVKVQSFRDELTFLSSVSSLNGIERLCFGLWIEGWSQEEIAARLRTSQQRVSELLRICLTRCYDSTPISFRRFSHHTVYRSPRRSRQPRNK